MSHSTRPTHQQTLDVLHLMADVAALKGDPAAQRQLLVDRLAGIVGISNSLFVVGEDWQPGGKARYSHMTIGSDWDPGYAKYCGDVVASLSIESDAFAYYSMRDPAAVQEWSFGRVLPDREAERRYPAFADCRNAGRLKEGIANIARLPGDRMIGLCLHPFGGGRPPTDRDRALALFALNEVERLVRVGHLSLPATAPADLPPRLRQILDRLLAGRNPKGIAIELGLSLWTVRDHIKRIYRHFGVSGRDELVARFVRT